MHALSSLGGDPDGRSQRQQQQQQQRRSVRHVSGGGGGGGGGGVDDPVAGDASASSGDPQTRRAAAAASWPARRAISSSSSSAAAAAAAVATGATDSPASHSDAASEALEDVVRVRDSTDNTSALLALSFDDVSVDERSAAASRTSSLRGGHEQHGSRPASQRRESSPLLSSDSARAALPDGRTFGALGAVGADDDLDEVDSTSALLPDAMDDGSAVGASGGRVLTVRSLVVGCVIGALVSAMNISFGLKTGWTQGGSVMAAVLAVAVFRVVRPTLPYTLQEAVMTTTAASSAATMVQAGGLVGPIPALKMLGVDKTFGELLMWSAATAFIGMYFAVPLRRQLIVKQQLRFPTGTATGETITALFSGGDEAVAKARYLLWSMAIGAGFVLLAYFVPNVERPPILAAIGAGIVVRWGWNIYLNPLLFGGGMLAGFHVSYSLLVGSVLGWVVAGVPLYASGTITGPVLSYTTGIRGWVLWVGVSMMTFDALAQLLLSGRAILATFVMLCAPLLRRCRCCRGGMPRSVVPPASSEYGGELRVTGKHSGASESVESAEAGAGELDDGDVPRAMHIPTHWWIIGLALSATGIALVAYFFFGLLPYLCLVVLPLSALLSMIASRCTGETDINPIGGMGKVTQLIFAGLAPGHMVTNLMSAAITAAGASQAGDMMHDLKTGYMHRSSPRKQFIAQHVGALAGVVIAVSVYSLFDAAYEIGGPGLPAPAAQAWKAVAEVLSAGFGALPPYAVYGAVAGAVLGVVLPFARACVSPRVKRFIPSSLAMGIAMIVPPEQAVAIFLGGTTALLWMRIRPKSWFSLGFSVASGLLAGDGIVAILTAVLKLAGVREAVPCWGCS